MSTRKDASSSATARRRLGRGLSSLLSRPAPIDPTDQGGVPSGPDGRDHAPATAPEATDDAALRMVALDQIRPNPKQPRRHFDDTSIDALAASMKSAGVMQPIVVRPDPAGGAGGFQLVVGERRWRAAQRIGLSRLPALVRHVDDRTAAEWALIENLQREDLNAIERAEALRELAHGHGVTHQEIADRVGLNRSSVTNLLRLNELDDATKDLVRSEQLSLGHAKTLLAITNLPKRHHLATLAVRRGWSVRDLERQVAAAGRRAGPPPAPGPASPAHHQDLERRLSEHLGTRVVIQQGRKKNRGRLVIEFYSLDQFDGLLERLGFEAGGL